MKKAIAVFDIDGTILKGTSAERIFVRFLLTRGELRLTDGINFVRHFLATFPRNWIKATKSNRFYLKGKKCDDVEALAEECFFSEIVSRVSTIARSKIEKHKSDALEIVLLSGTPDFLLRHFQEYLGADHAHGSMLTVSKGRYTGDIDGIYPYGSAKAEIVQTYYGSDRYDLSASYAYANHITDFAFLKLFGYPTLANPTPRLAAKAKEVGIITIFF